MSIADQITRIKNNIAASYAECSAKGATLPAEENSENLPNTIASISGGAGGGDEITCANETGKSLSEGDKVWINSASQVGGTDTKILNGYYINPIISSDGKYFYDVSLGIKIYQVVGNSVKFITEYNQDYNTYSSSLYPFREYRYKNGARFINSDKPSVVKQDKQIMQFDRGYLQSGYIVGTPASRFIFNWSGNAFLEEWNLNTGEKIGTIGEGQGWASDLFNKMVLLEDKYILTYGEYSDKRKILEINWDTRQLTEVSNNNTDFGLNPRVTLDEEFILSLGDSTELDVNNDSKLIVFQKQASLSYKYISLDDFNQDVSRFFKNKSSYTKIAADYDDVSQTLYLYGTKQNSNNKYVETVLIVRYNPSIKKWLTINNNIFNNLEMNYNDLVLPSFTSNLDTVYYNNAYSNSLYSQQIYQLQLETKTGLRANGYSDYSNKESTLTGYVSTGGNVNENVTVQTVLPPKINQTISVNADNATIEVEL